MHSFRDKNDFEKLLILKIAHRTAPQIILKNRAPHRTAPQALPKIAHRTAPQPKFTAPHRTAPQFAPHREHP